MRQCEAGGKVGGGSGQNLKDSNERVVAVKGDFNVARPSLHMIVNIGHDFTASQPTECPGEWMGSLWDGSTDEDRVASFCRRQ